MSDPLWDPADCSLPGSSVHGFPQARTVVCCHFLLQGIFLIQGSNLHLLHWKAIFFTDEPPGKPITNILQVNYACVCAKLLWSCPIFGDPMDCSPPGSSVYGIFQARILEQVAISSSRGSSRLRDWTHVSYVSCLTGRFFITEPPSKPQDRTECSFCPIRNFL